MTNFDLTYNPFTKEKNSFITVKKILLMNVGEQIIKNCLSGVVIFMKAFIKNTTIKK